MPESIVSVFARHRGRILLVRADATDGLWDAISVHGRQGPERTACRALERYLEPGHTAAIRRVGESGVNADDARPVLVDVSDRKMRQDVEVAWVHATEMLRRETVPGLWEQYRQIGPTRDTVLADRVHGSSTVSIHALEVLRDRAAQLEAGPSTEGWSEIVSDAKALATSRPELTALVTRIDRAMSRADGEAEALERVCRDEIDRAARADEAAARRAAPLCADLCVLSLSRSQTVESCLTGADASSVVLLESRPDREAIPMAESLACEGVAVSLTLDAAIAHQLVDRSIDLVLVGADTIDASGRVRNKLGTRTAALAARSTGVPFVVVTSVDKIAPGSPGPTDHLGRAELYDGDAPLQVACPRFDWTDPTWVDLVITEHGALARPSIAAMNDQHRTQRAWRRGDRSSRDRAA